MQTTTQRTPLNEIVKQLQAERLQAAKTPAGLFAALANASTPAQRIAAKAALLKAVNS